MNKIATIRTFFLAKMLMLAVAAQPLAADSSAQDAITLKAFMGMDYDQRVKICAKLVDSQKIGACASLEGTSDEAATASDEQMHAAAMSCAKDKGLSDTTEIASCARDTLNASKAIEIAGHTDEAFHSAIRYCVEEKNKTETIEVLICARSKLDSNNTNH